LKRAAHKLLSGAGPSRFGARRRQERGRRQRRGALRRRCQKAGQLAEGALGQVLQLGQRPEVGGLEQVLPRARGSQQPLDLSHGRKPLYMEDAHSLGTSDDHMN